MRCLYCGKEYWLPSRIKRDPDFCSPAHREKYNHRVDLAMRRIQESSAPPVPEPIPVPLVEIPAAPTLARETRSAPYRHTGATSPSPLPVNSVPSSSVLESSEPAPAATVAIPSSTAEQADRAARDLHRPLDPLEPRPDPFRNSPLLNIPRLAARPIFDRLEEEDESTQKRDEKEPAFLGIFSMPETSAISHRKAGRLAVIAIAASVAVALVLWFGANAGKFGRNLLNQGAAEMAASSHLGSDAAGTPETSSTAAPGAQPGPRAFQHPLEWVRSAAVKRATTHLAESFDNGMAAWGVKSNDWAPGWSRSPDGYVRPGQLALFQPTLNYADYRMEFFGQIENKSLSWVVRGRDTQNYYAMKVRIVKPGLRPLLSMVHYPVVEGKQGHTVELPLSIMVHNDIPYHVSVEVKGSHYTASIEGEEVASWSDDTLLTGGVGFFSEGGARARIYWMKLSKNDDWFGRFCGQIAGSGEPRDTARLDCPAMPVPPLGRPAPTPANCGALAMMRIQPFETRLTGKWMPW